MSVHGLPTSVSLAIFTFRPLPRTLYTYRLTQRGRRDKQLVVKLHLAAPSSVLAGTLIALQYVCIVLSLLLPLSYGRGIRGDLSHIHVCQTGEFRAPSG